MLACSHALYAHIITHILSGIPKVEQRSLALLYRHSSPRLQVSFLSRCR